MPEQSHLATGVVMHDEIGRLMRNVGHQVVSGFDLRAGKPIDGECAAQTLDEIVVLGRHVATAVEAGKEQQGVRLSLVVHGQNLDPGRAGVARGAPCPRRQVAPTTAPHPRGQAGE